MKFLVTGYLTKEERQALEEKGLFCYELRDCDMGNDINSIEKHVAVNNVGSIVTDKEVKFSESPNNSKNYLEFIAQNEPVNTIEELLEKNIFKVCKEKSIPIDKKDLLFSVKEGVIFDEEIKLLDKKAKDTYEGNKIRLIIHKDIDLIDVFYAAYLKDSGLCYCNFGLSPEEYNEFIDINDFVKQILIDGKYYDRGIGISTGKMKEDFIDMDISEDMFY